VVELWTVSDWNKHLFDAEFTGSEMPVTYLDAHPVGLTELLSWPSTEGMSRQAAAMLVDAHRPVVVRAAGSAVSAALRTCRDRVWRAQDSRPPPFFSLLWTTCLVAWGHPDVAQGDFAERWKRLFGLEGGGVQPATGQEDLAMGGDLLRRRVEKVEIRDLWELTARWLAYSPDHRDLVLPEPPPDRERHVGTSYALSQPDLRDRRWLARAVTDLDVAGYDPPPGPVLRGLVDRGRETVVSEEFLGQLQRLCAVQRSGGQLHGDPIWAAIRRECIDPVTSAGGVIPISRLTAVLEEYVHGDLGLLTWRADDQPPRAPQGTAWRHDARTEAYVLDGPDEGGQLWAFLERPWTHPRTGLARLVREGLVCFARDERARLSVVTGAEVANAEVALTSEDLVEPLRDWAGGSVEPTSATGWVLLRGADLRSVEERQLPEGLDAARQLVRTTAPPTARWVGGVRVGRGAYFRHRDLLPTVSAPGARVVIDETSRMPLLEDAGRWAFDAVAPPTGLHVRVMWQDDDGWPDIVLRARFEDTAVHPPRDFVSSDHELVGPEIPPILDREVGLHTRAGRLLCVANSSATARRAGTVVGAVDAAPSDAVMTHHGHPDRFLLSVLHDPCPEVIGKVPDASARRRWRRDVKGVADGRNVAVHERQLLRRDHPALVTLRRAADSEFATVALDQADARVLLSQFQRAYAEPTFHRVADELLAVLCIDMGRRMVSRRDYFDTLSQLTTAHDRITTSKLFSLLRAGAESGRFELARHRARPSVNLVGVRPRLRWARLASLPPPRKGVFEGALVGLVESATAREIADELRRFADTRWLTSTALPQESGSTDRLIAPVLKVMTDSPNRANEVAEQHLGGRLGDPGVLPGISEAAAVEATVTQRPGGFAVADSYLFIEGGPRHVHGRVDTDGVVVERLEAATRSDVYAVVADREVVYTSPDRDWAAVRASELAGSPLFGRCRHGVLRSRSELFPRLPMPIGRALLTHGFGLASSTFDETGRLASVTYPFGRGASALDRLPSAWAHPEECSCMIL